MERFKYDAYGQVSVLDDQFAPRASSSYDWEFRYTGRREDLETGLYYFRARIYSAQLGRFISRDPLGFVDGMSLYRAYFVPENMDPSGKIPVAVTAIIAGLACAAGIVTGVAPGFGTTSTPSKICRGITGCIVGMATAAGAIASGPFAGCIAGIGFGGILNGTNPLCDKLLDGTPCPESVPCLLFKTMMFGAIGCITAAAGPGLTILERSAISVNSVIWGWNFNKACKALGI